MGCTCMLLQLPLQQQKPCAGWWPHWLLVYDQCRRCGKPCTALGGSLRGQDGKVGHVSQCSINHSSIYLPWYWLSDTSLHIQKQVIISQTKWKVIIVLETENTLSVVIKNCIRNQNGTQNTDAQEPFPTVLLWRSLTQPMALAEARPAS